MKFFVLLFALDTVVAGQAVPSIVGAGYSFSSPLYVAPGQLVTLIVQGIDSSITQTVHAPASNNLPASLAGISFSYWQGTTYSAPILEVYPFSSCAPSCSSPVLGSVPATVYNLAAITVQIPFEAQSTLPAAPPSSGAIPTGELTAMATSPSSAVLTTFMVYPLSDQVHSLTTCDPFMTNSLTGAPYPVGLSCPSIVTHADGSLVSVTNPARSDEELVMYAVGLGQTTPASLTGQIVAKSAPTQTAFTLDFNYHPNALPSRPLPTGMRPVFAGSTPGYVGLYQVNFQVPPPPAGISPCIDASALPLGSNVVQSNLTVSVGGQFSFDGARICVAIP